MVREMKVAEKTTKHQKQMGSSTFFDVLRPSTRYQGSKEKIVGWIWDNIKKLNFDTFLDALGGTGIVSFQVKQHGKQVFYNDVFKSNYYVGLGLIENDATTLSDDDINFLLKRHDELDYDTFIQDVFEGIYYTNKENTWLDMIIRNIKEMINSKWIDEKNAIYKKALSTSALFQACLIKRPYNLFHRANLYMRFADVRRSFGNKATWDKPFPEHFKKFVDEYNSCIFSNGRKNKAFNLDVFDIPNPEKFDLVYIDTPYFSRDRGSTDYYFYYHFLEGLCKYLNGDVKSWEELIDFKRKPRPLKHDTPLENKTSVWTNKKNILKGFNELFKKFRNSIIVVSYNSEGIPSEKQFVDLLENYGKEVTVKRINHRYVLRPSRLDELLFIAA